MSLVVMIIGLSLVSPRRKPDTAPYRRSAGTANQQQNSQAISGCRQGGTDIRRRRTAGHIRQTCRNAVHLAVTSRAARVHGGRPASMTGNQWPPRQCAIRNGAHRGSVTASLYRRLHQRGRDAEIARRQSTQRGGLLNPNRHPRRSCRALAPCPRGTGTGPSRVTAPTGIKARHPLERAVIRLCQGAQFRQKPAPSGPQQLWEKTSLSPRQCGAGSPSMDIRFSEG